MTKIVFFRNNMKKTNKISRVLYFFPTHFLVHRKFRCPPKVPPVLTTVHIYIYIYEDISIRGITEAEIYFEPRHQFESILLLKILWSFSINHFEALFLIQWLPQHIITYCYREFAKISICFILYYMIEIRNYVYFTSLCI